MSGRTPKERIDNMKEMGNIITLNDENGNDVCFEFLDLVEYRNEEYVVLLPCEDENGGEVVILKAEDNGSSAEETYIGVEDADTLGEVFAIFREKFKNEFNFLD